MHTNFTSDMKKDHLVLVPSMLPIHFKFLKPVFEMNGYHLEVLETDNDNIRQEGLAHVHNDMCYPALLVIGQMIDALKSGKYDLNHVALAITQTGGGCRASNYKKKKKKALEQEGWDYIPVPYEVHPGDTERVIDEIVDELIGTFETGEYRKSKRIYNIMIDRIKKVERTQEKKIRVGIVGEIYMKYSPLGNQHLEDYLMQEGFEPVLSGVMDFALYSIENGIIDYNYYHMHAKTHYLYQLAKDIIMRMQKTFRDAVKADGTFTPPDDFSEVIANGKATVEGELKAVADGGACAEVVTAEGVVVGCAASEGHGGEHEVVGEGCPLLPSPEGG